MLSASVSTNERLSDMATKTRSASHMAKEWDNTIAVGDLVVLLTDSTPHIYQVLDLHPRVVMDHDLYNSPSLLSKGYSAGDELAPMVHIRRVRTAPFWEVIPPRYTIDRKVEAFALSKVTAEQVRSVIENLVQVLATVSGETDAV